MKLREIVEEYVTSMKKGNETIEVFKNPIKREMLEASKEVRSALYIRFIGDADNKDIYVFQPNVFHDTVIKNIFDAKTIDDFDFFIENQLWGSAKSKDKGRTWVFDGSDNRIPEKDWSWINEKGIQGTFKKRGSIPVGSANKGK